MRNADYISPDTLLPTGEVFDPATGRNVMAAPAQGSTAKDWWK
jgi:hypothetical protein